MPCGGCSVMKPVACSRVSLEMRPMQLGPISVTPAAAAVSASSCSACRPSIAGLGEPGGDDDGGTDAAAPALLEDRADLLAADGEERHVRSLGQLLDARVHRQAEERPAARAHRVERALEAAVEDVPECRAAPLVDVVGGADDGDRPGCAHGPQVGVEAARRGRRLRRTRSRARPARRRPPAGRRR